MGAEEEGLTFLLVIPGRAKREPGISQGNLRIPGLRLAAHPGMTARMFIP
jgi:hypothetical protein